MPDRRHSRDHREPTDVRTWGKEEVCDYKGGLEDWTAAERLEPVDVRTLVRSL